MRLGALEWILYTCDDHRAAKELLYAGLVTAFQGSEFDLSRYQTLGSERGLLSPWCGPRGLVSVSRRFQWTHCGIQYAHGTIAWL
jgi:hypothetical protein